MSTTTFPERIYFVTTIRRNSLDGTRIDRWYTSADQYAVDLASLGYLNEGESVRSEYYEPEEAVLVNVDETANLPSAYYRRADGREIVANEDGSIFLPRVNPQDLDDDYYSSFADGFNDEMPDDYCLIEDQQSGMPWCAPWCEPNNNSWYSENLSAYEAGRAWAMNVLSDWECFQGDEGNRLTLAEENAGNEINLSHVTATLPTSRSAYFHWYQGQANPQGAYIELDPEDGTLIADWNAESDAMPFAVYYGRLLRWTISPFTPLQQVRDLMREIAPLADRICAGYDTDYDSNSNLIGVLNDDAREAADEIESIIEHF